MSNEGSTSVLGWYVRVVTTKRVNDEPVTMLYLTGFPSAAEAEEAVRKLRSNSEEDYRAVATAIVGRGPQPEPREVRELKGAV